MATVFCWRAIATTPRNRAAAFLFSATHPMAAATASCRMPTRAMNDAVWIDFETRPQNVSSRNAHAADGRPARLAHDFACRPQSPHFQQRTTGVERRQQRPDFPPAEKSLEMPLLQGPGVITYLDDQPRGACGRIERAFAARLLGWGRRSRASRRRWASSLQWGRGHRHRSRVCRCRFRRRGAELLLANAFASRPASLCAMTIPTAPPAALWQVDYVELDSLPAETPRFYAHYRQEYPA